MTSSAKRSFFTLLRYPRGPLAAISIAISAVLFTISSPLFAEVGQQEITLPQLSEVVCKSYIVYDRTKGEILISQNPDQKIYPASMTKIMTAALALDNLATDQILTVSQSAMDATTPNSTLMGLKVGEEISVSELLYGLLLPSGNDAANVLAEAIVTASGYTDPVNPLRSKLDLFSDLMNQKVTELGLLNTHFVNANGLHDDNHYTTASDLAIIFNYAVDHADFRTAISSPTHVFKATNKHTFDAWYVAKNTNCILTDPWILGAGTQVAKVVGGKTGTTIPAGTGMTLLSVDKNGDELISIVCGIPYETANRLTSYMAAVLNAGAQACFDKDPVIRTTGNVMDNKPYNAAAGLGPSGVTGSIPTAVPTLTPTGSVTPAVSVTEPSAAQPTAAANNTDESSSFPVSIIKAHPVLSIAAGSILFIGILLVIVYFSVNRKRKRSRSGIRRI